MSCSCCMISHPHESINIKQYTKNDPHEIKDSTVYGCGNTQLQSISSWPRYCITFMLFDFKTDKTTQYISAMVMEFLNYGYL